MPIARAAAFDVDPQSWRSIRLVVDKDDGGKLEVTLLRPVDWLVEQVVMTELLMAETGNALANELDLANELVTLCTSDPGELSFGSASLLFANSPIQDIGSLASFSSLPNVIANELGVRARTAAISNSQVTEALIELREALVSGDASGTIIYLDMPELGAQGFASIVAIEPCPRITGGPGQIVTATFKHSAGDVLDLTFTPSTPSVTSSGIRSPASSLTLGVTASHPFWSVSREDFIPAGEMRLGEEVIGIDGQFFRLTSIVPRAGPENVYNFEVAIDHVYYVGEGGVLVHNACGKNVYTVVDKAGRPVYIGRGTVDRVRTALKRTAKKLGTTEAALRKAGYDVVSANLGSRIAARGMEQFLIQKAIDSGMKMSARKIRDGQFLVDGSTILNKIWSYSKSRLKQKGNDALEYQKKFIDSSLQSIVNWF